MKKIGYSIVTALAVAMCSDVRAATVDTRDASSPGLGTTFWVPILGQELSSPFYRDFSGDWGWRHNPVVGFTTATLNISAYDVDFGSGERDAVYIGTNNTGTFLGYLQGTNNAFSFANFDVSLFATELAAGLQIFLDIDCATSCVGGSPIGATSTPGLWAVSLSKSVLTTDGANPGNPNPGQHGVVPIPPAIVLFGSGLLGLGLFARRRKNQAT